MTQTFRPINLARKYKWVIKNININNAKKLGLNGKKKY